MAFPPENDPNNAQALPDYDGIGFDSQWSPQDWMTWHAALVTRYGQAVANSRFIAAWNGGGFFESPPLDARSFNSDFRDFARKNGILDALYSGLGVLAKPLGIANDVFDAGTSIGGGVKETGASLGGSLKWWIGAAVLVLAAVYLLPSFLARSAKAAVTK